MQSPTNKWYKVGRFASYRLHPILQQYLGTLPVKAPFRYRKLDRRNHLYPNFLHQIKMPVEQFLDVRDWCYTTWGPAVEYIWWNEWGTKRNNVHWTFDTRTVGRTNNSAIYLHSDAELTLFKLKWA